MKKKIISGVVALGVLPVLVFASTTNTSTGTHTGKYAKTLSGVTQNIRSGAINRGGPRGGHGEMGGMRDGFFFGNSKMLEELAASGVTVPTTDELKAYAETQKTAREAEQKLSDTQKSELKAIRDAAAKAEREYLRAQGITLPTEETIAKMEALQKQAMEIMKAKREEMMKNGKAPTTGSGETMPTPPQGAPADAPAAE